MNFFKSSCHCFHYGGALQVYSAIGNCAMIFQRHSIWRYRDNCAICNTKQKFANSMSISVSVAMSMSMYCQFPFPFQCPFPFPFPCPFLFPCSFPCCLNLNMALWIFIADTAIILSIPKGPTRWRRNLKGLSYERGWLKLADNLGATPFKRDLSNDTTFSQRNLAGQSL